MSKFKANKNFNYPIEEVFRGFIKITKREFRKFNDKNPIGTKQSKVVKDNGSTKIKMIMEVTNFETNNIYEITSKVYNDVYISRYTFKKINEEETRVTLEEEQHAKNFIAKVAVIFQSLLGASRTKKKINRMANGVTEEIELVRSRLERNAKKA